jgi:glycosyltransferase involved in cell wall biosynthesis
MHIAFVARESFSPGMQGQVGGIGRYAETMAMAMATCGARVSVLAQSLDSNFEVEDKQDIRITYLPKWENSSALSWRIRTIEAKLLNTALGRELLADIANKLRRALIVDHYIAFIQQKFDSSFDVVEFPECGAEGLFYLPRKHRLPCVVRIHCPTQLLIQKNFTQVATGKRLLVLLERFAAKRADIVTSPSRSAADLAKTAWKLTSQDPVIMPNLFNGAVFCTGKDSPRTAAFTILYSGRLEKIKGLLHFPAILARLAARGVDFQVRIIGRDTPTAPGNRSMKEWLLASFDARLKDRVTFLGQLNEQDLAYELNAATVGLYLSAYETFGYTALEAQACGLPVIASEKCGIGEVVVHNTTGFLVDPSDYDTIVEYLSHLYEHPELRNRMSAAAARHAAQNYSIQSRCAEVMQFYSGFIEANNKNTRRAAH